MAIMTRFGSPVRITWRHDDYDESGWVEIEFMEGPNRGKESSVQISELRADGGSKEIDQAARAVPVHTGRQPNAHRREFA